MKLLTIEEIQKIEPFFESLDEEETAQFVYSKGFYDKEFFADYFLDGHGYIYEFEKLPVPQHIKDIREILDKRKNFNLIVPRGHNKTTGILIRILQAICYRTEKNILYLSTEDLGEAGLGKIRGELETNETLINVFGHLVPKNSDDIKDKKLKKWRSKLLEFTNGVILKTMSSGQKVRGQRPTCIIVDDPQDNSDVESPIKVKKFNKRIFTSLYGTLLPGHFMCVIGTVISNICLVEYLRVEKKWNTYKKEACDDNFENVLRPEMWSKEALMEKKADMGTANFNQEFRHIPISKEDVVIDADLVQRYTEDEMPTQFDSILMGVDPIRKASQKSDDLGIVVVGVSGKHVYTLFSTGIKLSDHKAEEFISMVYNKFNPSLVLQEDNIEVTLIANLEKRGIRMRKVTSTKDKYIRLLGTQAQFERGEVFFRKGKDDKLFRQITNYPDVDHDDVMDALVFVLLHVGSKRGRGRKI